MSTQRVEIYPGVTIEVSGRLKRKAGVGKLKVVRSKVEDAERKRILGEMVAKPKRPPKYSRLLLDEAVELSKEHGVKAAAKITGISDWRINSHKVTLTREGKYTPGPTSKREHHYTMEQKRQCVLLAKKLMEQSPSRRAFLEAGRQLGMNGECIRVMYFSGRIKWPSSPQPQSPAPASGIEQPAHKPSDEPCTPQPS